MDKRLTTFMFAAMTLLLVNMLLQSWLFPPQKVARRDKPAAGDHADPAKPPGLPGDDKADGAAPGEKPDGDKPPAKAADEAAPAAPVDGNRDGNSNGGTSPPLLRNGSRSARPMLRIPIACW